MTHNNNDGSAKIVPQCTLPLTAMKAVDMIITELAVFRFPDGQLTLQELMPNTSLQEVRDRTAARFVEQLAK
jgi:3-oxoacid CoA-transferase